MAKVYSVAKTCSVCGVGFTVPPCRASTANTCSVGCRSKQNAMRYESQRIQKACEVCGEMFSFPKCQEKQVRKCCSVDCANELLRRRVVAKGDQSANWKGGQSFRSDGYIYAYIGEQHPYANRGPYILEHRVVMEALMREQAPTHHFMIEHGGVMYLRPDISVHHKNEDRGDNRQDNLLACTPIAHREIHCGRKPMVGETWPEVEGARPFAQRLITNACKTCGGDFLVKLSDTLRGGGKYCCRTCYTNRKK